MNKLNIVDMFCGGGGESAGLIEAAHDYNPILQRHCLSKS